MAKEKIKWTEQQARAILARGSDVLVTASAGTGKTAVLSGRCVSIVSDKSVCPDVGSILVLTFTEMAAEQMRCRIAERLRDVFLQNRDRHLKHQLILLQGADISTIHSFCKRLITEHFYELGLDPTFGVIDADEAELLKAEALEKTIDWAWQQSNLVQGLEQLLRRRDLRTTDGFLAGILELSNFLDGVLSRQNWCERAARLAEAADPFTSELGTKQKQIVAKTLRNIVNRLRHSQKLYENQIPGGDWAAYFEGTFIQPVACCIELLEAGDWDKCAQEIRNFQKPRFNKPKDFPKTLAELIHESTGKAFDSFRGLSNFALLNPDYLDKVGRAVSRQTRILIELVRKFDLLYSGAKRALSCLDFADLEHYALELLTDEADSDDNLSPSATALALRDRYKYIFVDEYQDINPVQQAILDALSGGDNVFVVGDVKQSIYAWRGAQPQIFLERLKPTSADQAVAEGLRVDLNANFRSAKGILDFVNRVFSRIMTAPFANIDYDDSAQLKPAPAAEPDSRAASGDKPIVEFHILDEETPDSNGAEPAAQEKTNPASYQKDSENTQYAISKRSEDPNPSGRNTIYDIRYTKYETNVVTSRRRQAAMIARRIRQMVGADTGRPEFQIYDKQQDTSRPVRYRDIVVLMRSLAKKANDYVEVLRLAGIPVSCQATAGYFEATEISDLLCLLKILDNPQRDIELAAVLRSPFFKLNDTELAEIKIHSRTNENGRNFYACVRQYSADGGDTKLAGRLKEILAQLEQWRTVARRGNLADLVWRIYRRTNYLAYVTALPNGQARRANLLKLHDRAIQFEGFASSAGIPSLRRFVEFIEKLQETGQDWAPAEPESSAGNAVRILSVHKSKGLEFPVVFLAELQSRFNLRDIHADCLANADDTLGLQIIDRESNSKLRSLAHEVIAEQKLSMALAEEMRILYVATTRARERLILTGSKKQNTCRRIITNGFFFGDEPIPAWQLRGCTCPLDWIFYGLSDRKILHNTFETGIAANTPFCHSERSEESHQALDDDLFSLRFYDQAQLKQLSEFVIALKTGKSIQPTRTKSSREIINTCPRAKRRNQLSIIDESLSWRYRFGDAPLLPAKSSVTQLTHRSDEYIKFDYSRALDRRPSVLAAAEPDLTKPIEPRLIGTATHLVIS